MEQRTLLDPLEYCRAKQWAILRWQGKEPEGSEWAQCTAGTQCQPAAETHGEVAWSPSSLFRSRGPSTMPTQSLSLAKVSPAPEAGGRQTRISGQPSSLLKKKMPNVLT